MKTISLKMDEMIFKETEEILLAYKKPRNSYINEALYYYNRIHKRTFLENLLREESQAVTVSSLEVLKEFESLDYELQTI